jgi:amino-acid N-acetyltransferase
MDDVINVTAQVELIREAFHYRSRFEGSTMVFKVDCPLIDDPRFPSLMKDVALLAKTGFRAVIVPSAKEWIDSVLKKYNIVSRYFDDMRITTSEAIPFVEMAAFHVATRFMILSASRVDAVIGNFVRARGIGVVDGVDMEHTGFVEKILLDSLERVMERGVTPILPCIGWNPAGRPYNVASDGIALSVADALNAIKLFIISADGCLNARAEEGGEKYRLPDNLEIDENGRIIRLTLQDAERILADNKGKPKLEKKLKLAVAASRKGVERVHIIDGREEGAILKELFSNMGAGTMLYSDEYEAIRPLQSRDVPDILRLMEPLMEKGVLIRRAPDQIQELKADFSVIDIDGSIRACAAFHNWGEGQAEIAAVATDPVFASKGLGRRIVHYLIEKAVKEKFKRVFVLTTTTRDWFEALGFKEASVESLPSRKRAVYDQKRKSKVFALDLSG